MAFTTIATNPGTGGPNLPSQTANSIQWPVGLVAYGVDGQSGNFTLVGSTNNQGLPIQIVDPVSPTYSATVTGLASAAACTDLFTITGSASKTIRVTKLKISGVQTTGGLIDVVVLKRSTANTAGTSTNPTAVPHDSGFAAATATINAYTANPTTGNLVGNVRVDKLFVSASTALGGVLEYNFGNSAGSSIVLRGTTQVLAVNLNGATVTGGAFDITVEWVENAS